MVFLRLSSSCHHNSSTPCSTSSSVICSSSPPPKPLHRSAPSPGCRSTGQGQDAHLPPPPPLPAPTAAMPSPPRQPQLERPLRASTAGSRTGNVARVAEQFQQLAKQQEEQQARFTARPLKTVSRLNVNKPLPVQPAVPFPSEAGEWLLVGLEELTAGSESPSQAGNASPASPAPTSRSGLRVPSMCASRPESSILPQDEDRKASTNLPRLPSTPPRPSHARPQPGSPTRRSSASSHKRPQPASDVFCLPTTAAGWASQEDEWQADSETRQPLRRADATKRNNARARSPSPPDQPTDAATDAIHDDERVRRRSSIRYKRHSNASSAPAPPSTYSPPGNSGHQRRRSSIRYIKDSALADAEPPRPTIASPNFMADNKAKFLAEYMRLNPEVQDLVEMEKTATQDKSWPWDDDLELPLEVAARLARLSVASVDTLVFSPSAAPAELGLQLHLSHSTAEASSRPSSLGLGDVHAHGVIPASSIRDSVYTEVSTDDDKRRRSVHWSDSDVTNDCPASDGDNSRSRSYARYQAKVGTASVSNGTARAEHLKETQRRLGVSSRQPAARSVSALKNKPVSQNARAAHLEDTQRLLAAGPKSKATEPSDLKLFPWLDSEDGDGASPVADREQYLARTMNALTRNAGGSTERPLPDRPDLAIDTEVCVDQTGETTANAYRSATARSYKSASRKAAAPAAEPPTSNDDIVASAYQGTADEGLGQGFGYREEAAAGGRQRPPVPATMPSTASSGGDGDEPARAPHSELAPRKPARQHMLFWGTLIPSTDSSRTQSPRKAPKVSSRLLAISSVRSERRVPPASFSHRRISAGQSSLRRPARRVKAKRPSAPMSINMAVF